MELPIKTLEQIAFNTRHTLKEHMLIVTDKSPHEKHLSQPLQTNIKHFGIANTFLTGYNGIFNATKKNKKFYFKKSITDGDDLIQITLPPGAYEIEKLNNEIVRNIIDRGHFTETDYLFTIKPNSTTLGSILEILPQGPIISFFSIILLEIFWDLMKLSYIRNIIYQKIELIYYHLIIYS